MWIVLIAVKPERRRKESNTEKVKLWGDLVNPVAGRWERGPGKAKKGHPAGGEPF
jgi:hypothetical protein